MRNIYKFASKAVWLGTVEAPDKATATENGAAEFKVTSYRAGDDTKMIREKGECVAAA